MVRRLAQFLPANCDAYSQPDVRFGSLADICSAKKCPLYSINGLMHRSKQLSLFDHLVGALLEL
jgi:hypothetical protein